MFGGTTTDLPELTSDEFEERLTSDDILVDFFNEFLGLPSFTESLKYNKETGVFEVVSDAAETLSRQIRDSLYKLKSQLFTNPAYCCESPMIDDTYTVLCLGKEQGMQWVKRERLPYFLQSDCYFEYRLAKCLFQLENCSNQMQVLSDSMMYRIPSAAYSEKEILPQGGHLFLRKKNTETLGGYFSTQRYLQDPTSPKSTDVRNVLGQVNLYLTEAKPEEQYQNPPVLTRSSLDHLGNTVANHVLSTLEKQITSSNGKASTVGSQQPLKAQWAEVPTLKCSPSVGEHEWSPVRNDLVKDVRNIAIHCRGIRGTKKDFEAFKSSLQGTSGEKVLSLWMDIEQLKTLHSKKNKNRLLVKMRSKYLLNNGLSTLDEEFLSRLDLACSSCWKEDKLHSVQSQLSEVLLLYWGQRFCGVRQINEKRSVKCLRLCQGCQLCPFRYIDLQLLHPDSCVLAVRHSSPVQLVGSHSSPAPQIRRIEKMLQALKVEPRAGFFFRHFCENSGNQLWENVMNFWSDLQEYHQLFHQGGLDPYKIQRQSQLLYSTYLCSAGQMNIRMDEESRSQILAHLSTPFEELFDQAEKHALTLLLEPWTHLMNRDREMYDRVDLQEEMRHVDTEHYAELKMLHTQVLSRQEQYVQVPPPERPRESNIRVQVPDQFCRYTLASLVRNRLMLERFHTFLEENFASVDLMCWLDIEELKRMARKDKTQLEEKSKDIKSKYLIRDYFFGPSSPANKMEQDEVLRLAGGRDHLLHGQLTGRVLTEVQRLAQSHIEKKWLPVFLASPEFIECQKLRPRIEELAEDKIFLRQRKKRQVWKHVEGAFMTSSKEVLALRRALLNPVTCLQFQYFVSLQGEFLENDVVFWLEVQRYKDLCHSHCDEATVQQKVTTIINCFINSSIPPALQIDIPPEQARQILERRKELGPYIFREAQLSVFSELLKLWPEFVEFRNSVDEEKVLAVLESRRTKHRQRLRKGRRELDQLEESDQGEPEKELTDNASLCGENQEDGGHEEDNEALVQPTQTIIWSYSKYIAALEQEDERRIRKQSQKKDELVSSSTGTDSVTVESIRSGGSRHSRHCQTPLPASDRDQHSAHTSETHSPANPATPIPGH